jgi:polar amino acid transport system substrate-binding protein
MRITHWFVTGTLTLFLGGCASVYTAPAPEIRQALAPTGRLRVGLVLGSPISVLQESASTEMKGIGFDLGKELARRMRVPFEPVVYKSSGALVEAAKSNQWDVTFLTVNPARAKVIDFTGPLLEIEFGYLVPSGSSISKFADVDRPGVRVAVQEKGAADTMVSRSLKNAQVVRGPGVTAGLRIVKAGKAHLVAANKPSLFEMSDQLPGSRVLDGAFATEQASMGIPKGRESGMAYARKFVEDAKSDGLVKAAIERAEIRGVIVAPLK